MTPWPTEPLAQLGTWFGGGTPPKSRPEFWSGGDVPWLSPKDMGANVITGTVDHITERAIGQTAVKAVPANSVAIVVRSGILERTVPIALVPFMTTLNQDMKAISPRPNLDARWLAWGLRANEQRILKECRKAGTTVASLETSRLRELMLPVPPLEEQQRIVAILEDHLSRIDAASQYLAAASRRCSNAIASSLSQMWISAMDSAPPQRLGDIAPIITGTTPKDRQMGGGDALPFVTPGDIGHGEAVLSISREVSTAALTGARVLEAGAVLVVCIGATLGKVGFTIDPVATNQQINGINVGRLNIVPAFLAALLSSPQGQRSLVAKSTSTTMPLLNKRNFASVRVPLPSRSFQEQLYQRHDKARKGLQRLAGDIEKQTRVAMSLRRALLAAAFSGQLTGHPSDMNRVAELAGA